ncbi:MAG: c-type cytochrome [Flavobacteriia bacterium]|nr:c-type cytochrome [Flavobacteriia bacterium]
MMSCEVEDVEPSPSSLIVPDHFPAMSFPSDNSFSESRWELGKKLFFDPALSRDSSISCGSCHKADFALADDVAISPGVEGRLGSRNSPSLFNVGYLPYLMREGGVPTLEMQVLVPIQEHAEMDFNIVDAAIRIANNTEYSALSTRAYNRSMDAFVITRALATYQRTMISGNSAYDDYLNGNTQALSPSQKRGMDLFFSSQTNCSSCHSGLLLSDHSFANNGLYEVYSDAGRMRLTNDSADFSLFRVPSLRNVEYTAPYMHDGSIATLEDVVAHYNSGGSNNPQKSSLIHPLQLSQSEMEDLVNFLKSLSDPSVLTDERFKE